jgi:hypothetical protein
MRPLPRGWLDSYNLPKSFRVSTALNRGTNLWVPCLPHLRDAIFMVPAMSNARPAYESSAWMLVIERIGWGLRERYRRPEELPLNLLRVLWRLDMRLEAPAHDN